MRIGSLFGWTRAEGTPPPTPELLPTNPRAQRDMHRLLKTIGTRRAAPEAKQEAARAIFDLATSEAHMHAFANLGGVRVVVEAIECTDHEMFRIGAMSTLAEMSFHNTKLCSHMGREERFGQLVQHILQAPQHSEQYKDIAVVCATCVAAATTESHALLRGLVPDVLRVWGESQGLLRADCVRFFNNLSVNEENREALQDVVQPLCEVMRTGNLDLACTSACCAVANLVGGSQLQAIDHDLMVQLMSHLVNALAATLQGRDYPPRSRIFYQEWKIFMSISKLCHSRENREALVGVGIVPLVHEALVTAGSDMSGMRCREYALRVLWRLCAE